MPSDTPRLCGQPNMRDAGTILAVRDALKRYDPLRMWGEAVEVGAHGDTVVLSGVVRSRTAKEIAADLARRVKGVRTVDNCLAVDTDLETATAQALADDPRTAGSFPGILVGVVFGIVYLKGTVSCEEVKSAAGDIARRVPGIRAVSNELGVEARAAAPGQLRAKSSA